MSERLKEIASDAARWAGEAIKEWSESFKDSPEAHCYSLILGGLVVTVGRWFL